ncbi:MAG: PEP-CTERM sorting domain-containing protein, partial [Myxococcota bacterium]
GAITQDFNLTISNTSFRAGTATFSISATDQTVLELGFFRTDGASMGNSASQFVTPTFGSWVINQAPEPGTTLLMGLGLFGLALAARRSRR